MIRYYYNWGNFASIKYPQKKNQAQCCCRTVQLTSNGNVTDPQAWQVMATSSNPDAGLNGELSTCNQSSSSYLTSIASAASPHAPPSVIVILDPAVSFLSLVRVPLQCHNNILYFCLERRHRRLYQSKIRPSHHELPSRS